MAPGREVTPPPRLALRQALLLGLRAVLSALILPGVVAGLLPRAILKGPWRWPLALGPAHWLGAVPLLCGIGLLLWTIADFAIVGRGTLAPWDPPRKLVTGRVYRRVRNPMYLGVLATVTGEGMLYASGGVLGYAALLVLLFHTQVVWFEEPWLRMRFGTPYAVYLREVPRWLPRRTRSPRRPAGPE